LNEKATRKRGFFFFQKWCALDTSLFHQERLAGSFH
jgi:hypothetical protein